MKRFIALFTCAAFTLSSAYAEEAPALPQVENQSTAPDHSITHQTADGLAVSPELADENTAAPTNDGRKQVSEAPDDGSQKGSGAGKYVLAACAIAVGIAALILVSSHSGHKK